jgi:hypothetical protein
MKNLIKASGLIGAFLSLICLAACGSSPPTATATIDLNPFRTEVAATVLAQVAQTLASRPFATLIPSPTATLTPAITTTQPASPSPVTTGTPPTGTPEVASTNLAQWISQSITDNSILAPGETFTITWRLKNAGSSTWTATYLLRFYSGNPFGAPNEVPLGREVLPGETVDISLKMQAPVTPGDYRTDWVLSNEKRSNFKQPVFLKITVAKPSTSVPTVTTAP